MEQDPGPYRERSDSVKRKRVEEVRMRGEDDEDDGETLEVGWNWRERLENLIADDKNKVNKAVGLKIMRIFGSLGTEMDKLKLRNAYLTGRLDEREDIMYVMQKCETYADKVKRPTVMNKEIVQRGEGNVLLVYPTKEGADSEETKQVVKNVIEPKKEGIQIRAIRKVNKGGVVIEAGSKKSAIVIKEAARKVTEIRCVEPRRMKPRLQIFDVEKDVTEDVFMECMFKQNLEDMGISETGERGNKS